MAGYVIDPEVIPQARDMPMGCWIAGLAMIHNYKYPVPGKIPVGACARGRI